MLKPGDRAKKKRDWFNRQNACSIVNIIIFIICIIMVYLIKGSIPLSL